MQVKKINRSAKAPGSEGVPQKKKNPVVHDLDCLYCGERGAKEKMSMTCCKTSHCHRAVMLPQHISSFIMPCVEQVLLGVDLALQ